MGKVPTMNPGRALRVLQAAWELYKHIHTMKDGDPYEREAWDRLPSRVRFAYYDLEKVLNESPT